MRWRDVGVDELIMLLKRYFGAARTDFYLENVSGPEQFIYYLVIRGGLLFGCRGWDFPAAGQGLSSMLAYRCFDRFVQARL